MLKDVTRDLEAAKGRLVQHVHALSAIREDMVAARDNLLWAAAYPDHPEAFGYPADLALGLQEPVARTLGTKARISYTNLVAALEEDARALGEFAKPTDRRMRERVLPTVDLD
jgi:hypothetical protein